MRAITLHIIDSCIRRLIAECIKIHNLKIIQFNKGKLKKFPEHSLRHVNEAKELHAFFNAKFTYGSSPLTKEDKIIKS